MYDGHRLTKGLNEVEANTDGLRTLLSGLNYEVRANNGLS